MGGSTGHEPSGGAGSRGHAVLAGLGGLAALALLLGVRHGYGGLVPLRGYSPLDAHLMAPVEGLYLATYAVLGALAAAGLGLAAAGLAPLRLGDRLAALPGRVPDRVALVFGAAVALLAAMAVERLVLGGAFLNDDETAMLFQARLLAEGRLYGEPTPFPGVLEYAMTIEAPRWFAIYPLGHPALIALSLLLGAGPHGLVALSAAGWAVGTFLLARHLFGRPTAFVATALLLLSPFFVLTSGTLAAQMTSGLCLLAAANFAVRADGPRPYLAAAGLGLSLGAAYLARPYTALAVGLPLGYLLVRLWLRGRTPAVSPLVVLLCGAPFVAAYLAVNATLTGSPWVTPYEMNFAGMFRLGFGQDAFGVVHGPVLALAVAGLAVTSLNAWALGWPLSLLPVGLGIGLGRPRGRVAVLAAVPVVVLLAHVPVPMAGVHDTGPLYYLEVLPVLVLLAARGLVLAAGRLEAVRPGRGRDLVAWLALAAALVAGVVHYPQQVAVLRSLADFNEAPYRAAERVIDGRAVVFFEEPPQTSPPSSWLLGRRPPRPDLSDRILYAWPAPEAVVGAIVRWSGGRRPYYMSRDPLTGEPSIVPLPMPADASGEPP